MVSDQQRISQAQALVQAAMGGGGFNQYEVMKRYLEAIKVPNIEQVLPNPAGPNAIPAAPDTKVQIEQMKSQERQLSLQVKYKLGMMKIIQEAELNRAKIMKLEADAMKAIEEAGGIKEGHKIAMIQAQIGAAKAKQDGLLRSIEIMRDLSESMGDVEYGTDARRVLGLEGESSDQGPTEGFTQ